MDKAKWQSFAHEEVSWWDEWLRTKGGEWPADFALRSDPDQPLPAILEDALDGHGVSAGSRLKVLDVGAGPMTNVGSRSARYDVEVVPVDPLADAYNELIDKYDIRAPNRSLKGEAEQLDRQFSAKTFDVVWICNSLDHSYDPVLGFYQAFKALKNDGLLILTFHRNEADHGDYQGLHNWNFDMRNGNFVIESRGKIVNMSRILQPHAKISVLSKQKPSAFKSKVVIAFQKQRELSLFDMVATVQTRSD